MTPTHMAAMAVLETAGAMTAVTMEAMAMDLGMVETAEMEARGTERRVALTFSASPRAGS